MRIKQRILRANPQSLSQILLLKRLTRANAMLWFKAVDDTNIRIKNSKVQLYNARPSRKGQQQKLTKHLSETVFNKPSTVLFSHNQVTGPIKLTLQNQHFQLFISHRQHRGNLGALVEQMPPWMRIVIALTISFVLCWLLARSISKPLLKIKNAAHALGAGNLSIRVDNLAKRSDELGDLSRSFNQMATQLQHNLTTQQRYWAMFLMSYVHL